ncbi:MFS transporter [Bradyrhizobium liaoningense]|uniref:MFS transporter n=1 Tax=Bradyrhizobium liaoningense TaxID=43992 RepID=UPI001BA874C4|nr:MFS transporter [Bradyrhizobium liaoningense]MBR0840426.1 MFS transporter [Bradyrhizobium liaoningense]
MKNRNWSLVIGYAIVMCISMSLPISGGSVILTAMFKSFNWDAASLGLIVVTNMATSAFLLPFAAKAAERFGIRVSMIFGFLWMGAGAFALSNFVSRPEQAIVAFGVAMGVTSAFSGVVQCQLGVAALFPKQRTQAFSALYAGTCLLAFGLITAISHLIALTSWREAWYVFIGAAAVGIVVVYRFVRDPKKMEGPADLPFPGDLEEHPTPAVYAGKTLGQAVRMPLYWATVMSMISVTASMIFLDAHAQIYLRAHGFSVPEAATSMSVMQIGMVLGNFGLGLLARLIELRRAMALALVAYGVAFGLLANVGGILSVAAFAIFAGVGFGAGQVGSMALLSHYWDHKIFPMLTATSLIVQTIGSGAVPILAGVYYDKHGSLLPPIYAMMALNLSIAMAILLLAGRAAARREPAAAAVA